MRLVDTSLLLDMLKVIKRSSITDRGAVPSRLNAMTAGMQTRMPCKSKSVSGKMDEKWMSDCIDLDHAGISPKHPPCSIWDAWLGSMSNKYQHNAGEFCGGVIGRLESRK